MYGLLHNQKECETADFLETIFLMILISQKDLIPYLRLFFQHLSFEYLRCLQKLREKHQDLPIQESGFVVSKNNVGNRAIAI